MIPEFFQSPEPFNQISILKTILGLTIVLFATFVGVEIKLGNDEEDPWKLIHKPIYIFFCDYSIYINNMI